MTDFNTINALSENVESTVEEIENDPGCILNDCLDVTDNGFERSILLQYGGPTVEVKFDAPDDATVCGYWGGEVVKRSISSDSADQLFDLAFTVCPTCNK